MTGLAPLPGFDRRAIETAPRMSIHVRTAGPSRPDGKGAPILFLHGHPQTSVTRYAGAGSVDV